MCRIEELLSALKLDPGQCDESGQTNELLEAIRGQPVGRLADLLSSDDPGVIRSVLFILSELGTEACSLLDAVVPLMDHSDGWIQNYAFSIVAVCSSGHRAHLYHKIAEALSAQDPKRAISGMQVLPYADNERLLAALASMKLRSSARSRQHVHGLESLLNATDTNIECIRSTKHVHMSRFSYA